MPDIVATQRNHITSGELGNKETASCGGVPGAGSQDSAFIYVNTYINTALDEDGYLWFANTSGYIRQTEMYDGYGSTLWYSACLLARSDSTITYGGDYGSITDRYLSHMFQRSVWKDDYETGHFTGNTTYSVTTSPSTTSAADSAGYWESGWTIDDLTTTTSGGTTTAYIWVAYPIYYGDSASDADSGDTAVSLDMVRFSFDITELVSYYPFAVYLSSTWNSCNRDGGSLTKYSSSGSWTDLKNIEGSEDSSTVFNYSGSNWEIAPLIGET